MFTKELCLVLEGMCRSSDSYHLPVIEFMIVLEFYKVAFFIGYFFSYFWGNHDICLDMVICAAVVK